MLVHIFLFCLDSSKELPKTWKPMADNENLVLVTLQTSDKEYKDVEKEFINTLGRTPNIIKVGFL